MCIGKMNEPRRRAFGVLFILIRYRSWIHSLISTQASGHVLSARIKLCLLALPLFFSCKLVSFENLKVAISVQPLQTYYEADAVFVNFSIPADYESFREITVLKKYGKTVSFDITGSRCNFSICPVEGWQLGASYSLIVDGSLKTDDGRLYTVHEVRHFAYGKEHMRLTLTSFPEHDLTNGDEPLVFVFSKPVVQTSFLSAFSLSPHVETEIAFSDDNAIVTVQPASQWTLNTIMTWKINANVCAADGYCIVKAYDGALKTVEDTTLPELRTVCPARFINGSYVLRHGDSLNALIDDEGVAMLFSKQMNLSSLEKNIAFEPNVPGCMYALDESNTSFVFQPYGMYAIDTQYRLAVGRNCADVRGLKLYDDKNYFFTSRNSYLAVTSISAHGTELIGCSGIPTIAIPATNYLTAEIAFSTSIDKAHKAQAEKSLSCSPLFPSSSSNPVLISITWNIENTIASAVWKNFTCSNSEENYYQIKINGKKSGVSNVSGEYMKEDICVTFVAGVE